MLPNEVLSEKSMQWQVDVETEEFAKRMDGWDPLASFRDKFSIPLIKDMPTVGKNDGAEEAEVGDSEGTSREAVIYLSGNSLGLKPKASEAYVNRVLADWGTKAMGSHFHGFLPSALSDVAPKEPMARIVGARSSEIAIMNGLTVNLHLLLATFYAPTPLRHKIVVEENAFPSDMLVVKSQISLRGFSASSLITLKPKASEYIIRETHLLEIINDGADVALILIPGINYYSGQYFNIPKITAAAHEKGIIVGVDLAHAAGNVPLHLHDWGVDFAAWCTYKYLNAGAGSMGAVFVHEMHTSGGARPGFPMLRGWWGQNMKSKFATGSHGKPLEFDPLPGADMFKLSNPSPVLCSLLMASLDIFGQTSMDAIHEKQVLLTGYLELLLNRVLCNEKPNGALINGNNANNCLPSIRIITPSPPSERGAQLSLIVYLPIDQIQEELQKRGIVCEAKRPGLLRVAPVALYNSFRDVYTFVYTLEEICRQLSPTRETNG